MSENTRQSADPLNVVSSAHFNEELLGVCYGAGDVHTAGEGNQDLLPLGLRGQLRETEKQVVT